jgi:IS5 family transposase
MRPKKHKTTRLDDLFRARPDQIINMKHALVQLAGKVDWDWIDMDQNCMVSRRSSRES